LQVAEKDYLLALVMQIITESPLGRNLVFKGGTAIHHCCLDQLRFSEDLDFSSGGQRISLQDVRTVFTGIPFLSIRKYRLSEATIKI
jgi:predicted nucleotidyltransferase component of viral defense system